MPIEAKDLFAAAQALNRMKPPLVSDEVCARTMANRMYYAAYLATREAVRTQLGNPGFDVNHATLAESLSTAQDADVRAIGTRLQVLKALREVADYKPHRSVAKPHVALQLVSAEYVLDNVARLAGRFPHLQGRQGR